MEVRPTWRRRPAALQWPNGPTDSGGCRRCRLRPDPPVHDALPAIRTSAQVQRAVHPAEGVLSICPAATDLAVSSDGRHLVAAHYGQDAVSLIDVDTLR